MTISTQPEGHRLTWLAVILVIIFQIPGFILGFGVSYIYRAFLGSLLEGNLFDWLAQGWISKLALAWFPALLSGAIAGGVSVWLTSRILKHANYEIVMYAVAAIVIAFTIVVVAGGLAREGINLGIFEIIANTFGVVIGLYGAQISLKEEGR